MIRRQIVALATLIAAAGLASPSSSKPAGDAAGEKVGAFVIVQRSDPMTDEVRWIAKITIGNQALSIKCDTPGNRSVYVHLVAGQFMGRDGEPRMMEYRVDEAPLVTQTWLYQSDGLFVDESSGSTEFLTDAAEAKRLRFRAYKFDGSAVLFDFPVNGIKAAAIKVATGCKDQTLLTALR